MSSFHWEGCESHCIHQEPDVFSFPRRWALNFRSLITTMVVVKFHTSIVPLHSGEELNCTINMYSSPFVTVINLPPFTVTLRLSPMRSRTVDFSTGVLFLLYSKLAIWKILGIVAFEEMQNKALRVILNFPPLWSPPTVKCTLCTSVRSCTVIIFCLFGDWPTHLGSCTNNGSKSYPLKFLFSGRLEIITLKVFSSSLLWSYRVFKFGRKSFQYALSCFLERTIRSFSK